MNILLAIGAFLALFLTPGMAIILNHKLSRQSPVRQKQAYAGVAVTICLLAVLAIMKISFSSFIANAATILFVYALLAFLAIGTFRIKPRIMGILTGTIFSAPLVVGFFIGCPLIFISTIFFGDATRTDYETRTSEGYVCRACSRPLPLMASSGTVKLYRQLLPGVEITVDLKNPSGRKPFISYEQACMDLSRQYNNSTGALLQ
jgi:hypothetical protein